MKILICPDSFKESLTATEVANAIDEGIRGNKTGSLLDTILCPISDGGEGIMALLTSYFNGEIHTESVAGPLSNPVDASFGIINIENKKTAIIEMAEAAGLHLVPAEHRNPMVTTTFGLGELINKAISLDVTRVIIGLGGSATNDAGVGMLQAMGFQFYSSKNEPVKKGNKGLAEIQAINSIARIDLSPLKGIEFIVASDVKNPLTGPTGASLVFGPQKGATQSQALSMDENMKHFSLMVLKWLNIDIQKIQGGGAAGGLGASLVAFLNAQLVPGFDLFAQLTGLEEKIKSADLIVTGEGSLDAQSLEGKAPFGVAILAKKYNKKVIGVCGISPENEREHILQYFNEIIQLKSQVISKEKAIRRASGLLIDVGKDIAKRYA